MKSRQGSSNHSNISVKRLESEIVKNYGDLKGKKPSTLNTYLQKSAQLLQSYNQFFQTTQNLGDANSYFKQSLRNYEKFDVRSLHIDKRPNKTKSIESFKSERPRKQRSFLTASGKDRTLKHTHSHNRHSTSKLLDPKPIKVENIFSLTDEEKKELNNMGEEGEWAEGEDPFTEVDELVDQVEGELEQVRETIPEESRPEEAYEDECPPESAPDSKPSAGDGSAEEAILREVEECEKQCVVIYEILGELKQRVTTLLSKDDRTPEEEKELAEKQIILNEKMQELEKKTIRIEELLKQVKDAKKQQFNRKHSEDVLPKVIICGLTEENAPKLIICDDKKKKKKPLVPDKKDKKDVVCLPQIAKRLNDCYCMQEKLVDENADLERTRYRLQEDLLDKDQCVESLQRQLCGLQCELRMVVKENALLNDKLQCMQFYGQAQGGGGGGDKRPPAFTCGKGKGPCPAAMEQRLQEYSDTTQVLEKQLGDMECEVRNMQNELVAVQKERMHLEQHRRMICNPPCQPICSGPCPPSPCSGPCNRNSPEQQLRELKEKYYSLQDDYKGKLTEVAGLRADVDQLKKIAKICEDSKKNLQEKYNEIEKELKELRAQGSKFQGNKEMIMEQEQQLAVAKQRFRETKDELEEVRALVEDQQSQLDDYRNKYLQAQQQVEEQRRQIDMMELENNRINEQVNLEIQRVKNQFQEKLHELTPLPDILKATQIKLQEAQQMHMLAERNNEGLVRELQAYRDKAVQMADQMEKVKSDQELGAGEKADLQQRIAEWEQKYADLLEEDEALRAEMRRLEEAVEEAEKRVAEKCHEIAQLTAEVDNVRDESARQVSRTKDRCETVRRQMQNQISDLERQLAQSKAAARAAQKDRDEIRQKMQSQINNLNENFEDAQMRIRNLQGHVNFLKNSYTAVFNPELQVDPLNPCNCGPNM